MTDQARTVDIEALVHALFERTDNTETDAQLQALIEAQAPLVREIAAACERTEFFQRSAARFAAFRVELERDYPGEERLMAAWLHFLDRIASAPTRLHLRGAVRLCVPLVARYLPAAAEAA